MGSGYLGGARGRRECGGAGRAGPGQAAERPADPTHGGRHSDGTRCLTPSPSVTSLDHVPSRPLASPRVPSRPLTGRKHEALRHCSSPAAAPRPPHASAGSLGRAVVQAG